MNTKSVVVALFVVVAVALFAVSTIGASPVAEPNGEYASCRVQADGSFVCGEAQFSCPAINGDGNFIAAYSNGVCEYQHQELSSNVLTYIVGQ